MTSVGDSFAWPFQDPGWFGKIVLQGLIFIIPIVGWIALVGWLVMTIDNYRADRRELPPAGFHLERGLPLFVVLVVWGIVFAIPGILLGSGRTNSGTSSLGSLVSFALSLFLAFLTPAIILKTYRDGFTGGFDVSGVWQMSTGTNTQNTVIAGLLIYVARIIGGIGICAICIGLLFTIPYSVAVTAGVVTWFERQLAGPAPAGQTPAAS